MKGAPKPAEVLARARQLLASFDATALRLAVLASFTADFLKPHLVVEAADLDLRVMPWIAPFGMFEQQVLANDSPLWSEPVGAVWLTMRIEDVEPNLVHELPAIGPEAAAERIGRIRQRLVSLAGAIRQRSSTPVLVSNFSFPTPLDLFDANDPDGLAHLVAAENRELARALQAIPGAHVFDWAGVALDSDPKLWYLARLPLSAEAQPLVARRLARTLRALLSPAAKCVVVDLDGTLWGGVLGDDGPEGIQLGDAHPGRAYRDVQCALAELRNRGFLLAIATKNDEPLVRDTLARHPEMVLRPSDFAQIVANWLPKANALRQIARELNIGLDSLVFLDDNPVERAHIRSELPMVHVVDLPTDPLLVPAALRHIAQFDRPRLLDEDRGRARMVAQDVERRHLETGAHTVEDFLSQLEMVATVGACDSLTLERIHQLLHKTNQFNLTTRRHSVDEISRLARSPHAAVRWLRLRDRFGDLGLVCVGIVRAADDDPDVWEIDTLLMSCRVMGRQVEDAFLSDLRTAAAAGGARHLRGVYRPTARNHMVANFYLQHGFVETSRADDRVCYELPVTPAALPWPEVIQRAEQVPS
jgi:FkbH-like protein